MNCGIRVQLEEFPAALKQELERIDELWQQGFEHFGGPFLARAQTYRLKLSPAAQNYVTRLLTKSGING